MSNFIIKALRATQNAVTNDIRIPIKLKDLINKNYLREIVEKSVLKRKDNSKMYSDSDQYRPLEERSNGSDALQHKYRSEFRRDYGRIIHSPGFRRLQGKTQLYPSIESDFFRNRLTHSLEVAQIAKAIAARINYMHFEKNRKNRIDLDLIEVAALAHDMGHPPFGHQGEEALNECMHKYGGFEGNAQTLRLLAKIEKKRMDGYLQCGGFKKGIDRRYGLNLTYRALASVLKYDEEIPEVISRIKGKYKIHKGYYASEANLVKDIKHAVAKDGYNNSFKTIECQIMDIADDIAYSTFDLEDAFKAGFITPLDIINLDDYFFESVSKRVNLENKKKNLAEEVDVDRLKDIISDLFKDSLFKLETFIGLEGSEIDYFIKSEEFRYFSTQYAGRYSYYLANDGYTRTDFSSQLINSALSAIEFTKNTKNLAFSTIKLNTDAQIRIEILKQIAFQTQILSPKLKIAEVRGKEIIKKIFYFLTKNPELLPQDIRQIYFIFDPDNKKDQYRTICDYIACMTDKYAIELYGRLTSETPETIFKPF